MFKGMKSRRLSAGRAAAPPSAKMVLAGTLAFVLAAALHQGCADALALHPAATSSSNKAAHPMRHVLQDKVAEESAVPSPSQPKQPGTLAAMDPAHAPADADAAAARLATSPAQSVVGPGLLPEEPARRSTNLDDEKGLAGGHQRFFPPAATAAAAAAGLLAHATDAATEPTSMNGTVVVVADGGAAGAADDADDAAAVVAGVEMAEEDGAHHIRSRRAATTFQLEKTLIGQSSVYSVAITPDSKYIVSGGGDGTIKVLDLSTKQLVSTLTGHSSYVLSVAVTPDSKHIVSGSHDKTVKVWDLSTKQLVSTLTANTWPSGRVFSVAVTPDSKYIVSGADDATVKVWDLSTKQLVSTLSGHSRCVHSVAVSPDSKYIVSGADDATVKVWDLSTKQLVSTLTGHSGPVLTVAVLPDSKYIVSGSSDVPVYKCPECFLLNTIKVWLKGCTQGQYFNADANECFACPANTYQASSSHRTATCPSQQPTCGEGQQISADTKTAERTCHPCAANTYQTSSSHRTTPCPSQQPTCGGGQQISADTKTAKRTCSACPPSTYQTSSSHRATTCWSTTSTMTTTTSPCPELCDAEGTLGQDLTISGMSYLDGDWNVRGQTADGKLYFANSDGNKWLYYDSDCTADGASTFGAAWLIANAEPSTTKISALRGGPACDGDGLYGYYFQVDDSIQPEFKYPKPHADWQLNSNSKWTTFTNAAITPTDCDCICKGGYVGNQCETNNNEVVITECSGRTCSNHGSCVNLDNDYRCECELGYSGTDCETNINECTVKSLKTCSDHGSCVDQVNAYSCECTPGYVGTDCETNVNECSGKTCSGHGSCIDLVNAYRCECTPGYAGSDCETNVDECDGRMCSGHGNCIDKIGSYQCDCTSGYTGENCQCTARNSTSDLCLELGASSDGSSGSSGAAIGGAVAGLILIGVGVFVSLIVVRRRAASQRAAVALSEAQKHLGMPCGNPKCSECNMLPQGGAPVSVVQPPPQIQQETPVVTHASTGVTISNPTFSVNLLAGNVVGWGGESLTDADDAGTATSQESLDLTKFVAPANTLVLGGNTWAGIGLTKMMGVDATTYRDLTEDSAIKKMTSEFQKSGTKEDLASGDEGDLNRVTGLVKGTYCNPEDDSKTPLPSLAEIMASMEIIRLTKHGLQSHHVLAIRLYTSKCYQSINKPMRGQPHPQLPHPFAATLYYITTGLKILRTAAGAGKKESEEDKTFWRGMSNIGIAEDFTSGTDMSCMSTTEDFRVAMQFANSDGFIFRVVCNSFMNQGAHVGIMSVYPHEKEVLYPPLTYLKIDRTQIANLADQKAIRAIASKNIKVITVRPIYPDN